MVFWHADVDAADQSGGPPSESGGPPCGDDGPPPPGNPLSGPPPPSPHRPSMSQMMMRMSLESLRDGDGEIPQTQNQTGG